MIEICIFDAIKLFQPIKNSFNRSKVVIVDNVTGNLIKLSYVKD